MAHSILINIEAMKIVAASDQKNSAKCLAILADIMKLPDNYLIIGSTMEWFKKTFNFDEQLKLYSNTTGDIIKRAMPDTVIYQCIRIAENFKLEERTSDELEKALGRPFTVVKTPAPEKSSRRKIEGALPYSVKRPRAGTVTGKVWEICDRLLAIGEKLPTRDGVLLMTGKEGINPSTAITQYGKWKGSK